MRRIVLILMMALPSLVIAQKAVKPNLNKVLKYWQDGDLASAKEMIDIATTYEKTMNDGKTWYYRGLVYASLDTTSNDNYKTLADNPLATAMESFKKADELGKKGSEYFINDASGFPVLRSQQMGMLANAYLNMGAAKYQEDDLEGALEDFEKVMLVMPDDTTSYFYAGIVSNSLENYDRTVKYWKKYYEKGGTSPDGYSIMINTYSQQKDDKEGALAIVKEARQKFPNDTNFPKVEIGLLIDLGKIDQAKAGLEEALKSEPDNKVLHFYLGYVNSKLENWEESKKNYEAALKIDPTYFEAQYYLAQIFLIEAEKIRTELGSLGISAADQKKKFELDKVLVEKYKIALPYWEKAEKLKSEDVNSQLDVLDKLSNIYYYLGEDAKQRAIDQKIKLLGGDDQ